MIRPHTIAISALIALLLPLSLSADEPNLNKEISFGVKMAERGLWSEALFRFKRAADVRPDDGRVLNNLAVAYEAVGEFDQALETYQRALRAAPSNRELKRNYSRFIEFYQSFKPSEDAETEEEAEPKAEKESAPSSSRSGQ